jgi:orotate phosphoribosyltransferase
MSNLQDLLGYLKKDGCYLENQHFKLVSGKHSDAYIQARIGMMNPETCGAFATEMADKLSSLKPTMLASSTVGGLLLASATATLQGVPLLVGRQNGSSTTWVIPDSRAPKSLSKVILIDNILTKVILDSLDPKSLSRVVFIDDILTTGATLISATHSLRELGATIVGVFVAIDRSGGKEDVLEVDGSRYKVHSLLQLFLNAWDPTNCPICPKPYTNLHNPEQDFLSVILSMPPQKSETILKGYEKVYTLQQDEEQLKNITTWRPWLSYLFAGLPMSRVGEDSGLAQFIRLLHQREPEVNRKRVLTEIVGHLLAVSNIKVESRSLGCSILIGDERKLHNMLPLPIQVKVPEDVSIGRFNELIPYYDALLETRAAFLFDRDGTLFGIRYLVRSTEFGEIRGIQLLRQLTRGEEVIGLVLRRKRKAITVYRKGKLEAIAELSEKTGMWEFNTTLSATVKEVNNRLPGIEQTLELVLEISREMINRGYGGLFVVGDVPPALQCKPPKIKMEPVPLESLGIDMAAEIAKLGGAMFVSKDGEVQKASVIIVNNSDNTGFSQNADAGSPRIGGSRRETARMTSLECPEAAVVSVSQNGTIDIFMGGKSWPISEAISGLPG